MDDKELLKYRAKNLAKQDDTLNPAELYTREILGFMLSGEQYAIETKFVTEALSIHELTPVPGTPAYLNGIMNVRGRIVPVINLKKFFNLKEEGITASTKAIILRDEFYEVAVLTDAILPTSVTAESSIKPVPSNIHGIGAEHLLGVTHDAVIIIDGKSFIKKLEQSLTGKKT